MRGSPGKVVSGTLGARATRSAAALGTAVDLKDLRSNVQQRITRR